MSDPVELVLSRLDDPKPAGDGKWMARCPAHEDRRPSLSIAKGGDGCALVKCHAGCSTEAVLAAMDLKTKDLFPPTADTTPNRQRKKGVVSARSNGNGHSAKVYSTCAAAVTELEKRHGKRAAAWTYHDAKGDPVGMAVRWNRSDGTKDIRPVSRNGDGWRIEAMPAPRPLYRLPELLASSGRVFVVEGEKAADAGRAIGLTVTTSAGGSGASKKADWRPLAGRDVVILPDNDPPGRKYAETVAAILAGLLPPATVRVVELPGLPDGGDIVEYVEAARSAGLDDAAIRANVEKLASESQAAEPAPRPPALDAIDRIQYSPDVVCLADVEPAEIPWLWPGRIPIGRLSLLVGRPGAGKSFLTCDIAARLSRAMFWPDGGDAPTGDTLFICAEDDPADTIVPRLDGANADRRRVHLLRAITIIEADGKERSIAFDLSNVDLIKDAIASRPNVKLIVIDPIGSYLGGQVDSHRDNEVRSMLAPLAALAAEYGVAILLVCHTRKAAATFADDMALGSRAFVGLARSVLHLSEDADDRKRKLLLPGKCNLSISPPGLAFRIDGDPAGLEWEPEPLDGFHADDAMTAERGGDSRRGPSPARRDAAAEWLAKVLLAGPVGVAEIKDQARDAGLSWSTIRRAYESLGIVAEKQAFSGGWTWQLPIHEDAQVRRRCSSNDKLEHLRQNMGENDAKAQRIPEDAQVSDNLGAFGNDNLSTLGDAPEADGLEGETEWTG